jgi:hypothetical protein
MEVLLVVLLTLAIIAATVVFATALTIGVIWAIGRLLGWHIPGVRHE